MRVKDVNLFGTITDELVGECIRTIQETVEEESKKLPEDRVDIRLNVYTNGGSADAMLALCDIMEDINKNGDILKIHTHLLRKAYSAGFPIWLCGFDRTISNSGEAMYHDLFYIAFGLKEEHKDMLVRSEVLEDTVDNIIIENFKITKDDLDDMRDKRKDRYFSRDELLKGLKVGYRRYKK